MVCVASVAEELEFYILSNLTSLHFKCKRPRGALAPSSDTEDLVVAPFLGL